MGWATSCRIPSSTAATVNVAPGSALTLMPSVVSLRTWSGADTVRSWRFEVRSTPIGTAPNARPADPTSRSPTARTRVAVT